MRLRFEWLWCVPLFAAGCSRVAVQERVYDLQAIAAETYTVRSPSQVMPGMLVSDPEPDGDQAGALPWWHNRNDSRLGIRQHPKPLQVTETVTYTDDQQNTYSTFQSDYYRRYSRTIRYGQVVH